VIGINDRGQIVGLFGAPEGGGRGVLLDGGVFTEIDVPGAVSPGPGSVSTAPGGITDGAGIAGEYLDPQGMVHCFVLADGVFAAIDVPGSFDTAIRGINDRGQIVGFFADSGA
jgi:hypothetical protein